MIQWLSSWSDSSSGDTDDGEQSYDWELHSWLRRQREATRRATPEVCRLIYAASYHICTFKMKQTPRRLANKPLSKQMRERINLSCPRDGTYRYCYMLYRAAHAKVVFKENRRREVEEFASFLEELKRRAPLALHDGKPCIHIPIRNALTGDLRLAKFERAATYGDLYHLARSLFEQPVRATAISMRLTNKKKGWVLDWPPSTKL